MSFSEMMNTLLKIDEADMGRDLKDFTELQLYPSGPRSDRFGIRILWAPVDFVNLTARIAIVGVTPGPTQAIKSYRAARQAIKNGTDVDAALQEAKAASSFRGKTMEPNLKSLLEHSGAAERAGIDDIDELWTGEAHKVHFTSTIRYPTYFKDDLFNNQIDSLSHPELRKYVENYLASELQSIPSDTEIIALGHKGPRIIRHAAKIAKIDLKRITALPHPSGSANGAVRDYLSKVRTKSKRPCRCMLCDRSRIPDGWDLSSRFAAHDRTHGRLLS